MKKTKLLAILTVMITMLTSVCAPAAVYDGAPDVIEITGGIDMDKKCEYTFNETRTITGKAESGTNIVIDVCSYDEDNVLSYIRYLVLKSLGKFHRRKLLSLFVKEDHIVARTDVLEYQFSFTYLYLFLGQRGYLLEFRNLYNIERYIMSQAGHIYVQTLSYPVFVGFSDSQQCDFHRSS